MKDKLLTLLCVYTLPLVLGSFHGVTQRLQINGNELGVIGNFGAGFVFGMMIEGLLMMILFTGLFLFTDKMD